MRDLLLRARLVIKTSNTKISRHNLTDHVKKKKKKKKRRTIVFPHLTNQIIDLWACRCRCRFLSSLISSSSDVRKSIQTNWYLKNNSKTTESFHHIHRTTFQWLPCLNKVHLLSHLLTKNEQKK